MALDSIMIIIMSILTVLYVSWVVLFFWPSKKFSKVSYMPISVIIPAYNEEKNIRHTIMSVIEADYPKGKEIIVVDDGSRDSTASIVREMSKKYKALRLIRGHHSGKGGAVNLGVRHAANNFVAVLDADTKIEKGALLDLFKPFSDGSVGAVSAVLRVSKSRNVLNWFQQLDYAISSSWRYVVDKVNGSCIVPGFCAFRKSAFLEVGGFHGDNAVEDYDICMYLRKAGYKIRMTPDSVAYTRVPETLNGLVRQRARWNRGTLQVIRKHNDVLFSKSAVGYYSVPTQLYWFFHAFAYLPLVIYQIATGYFVWFVSYGKYLTPDAIMYFVKWLTTYGMAEFIYNIYTGVYPSTVLNIITIIVFGLSYTFAVASLIKFSKKINPGSMFAIFFFFPYSILMLSIYVYSAFYEVMAVGHGEKWEKER